MSEIRNHQSGVTLGDTGAPGGLGRSWNCWALFSCLTEHLFKDCLRRQVFRPFHDRVNQMVSNDFFDLGPTLFDAAHLHLEGVCGHSTASVEALECGFSVPVKPPNFDSVFLEEPDEIETCWGKAPINHRRLLLPQNLVNKIFMTLLDHLEQL